MSAEQDVDALARELCGAAGKVNWTHTIPAVYRDQARHILAASDWLAERDKRMRREGAAEALVEFGNRVATPKEGQDGPTLYGVWHDAMDTAAALRDRP